MLSPLLGSATILTTADPHEYRTKLPVTPVKSATAIT